TGSTGRERLRVLARATEAGTGRLLDEVGVAAGMACLDVGCGAGDVARLLAERVGATGRVLGVDLDAALVAIAAGEAAALGLAQLAYRPGSALALAETGFDIVYARFLLTHLREREAVIARMLGALRPGGAIVLEDIDFAGHFAFPELAELDAFCRLYTALTRSTGGDAEIGRAVPSLLRRAGLRDVEVRISQPASFTGEAKLITVRTMQGIAARVVDVGLATAAEVEHIIAALERAAADPDVLMGMPRIVQAWGRKA
ncbi:MAG: methyltransferase domain-containing protein, partial [Geminicoccaceae bacterium]